MSKEHDAREVEALALALYNAAWPMNPPIQNWDVSPGPEAAYKRLACFALDREAALVAALESIAANSCCSTCRQAALVAAKTLAAHRLTTKPLPTLAEAVGAMLASAPQVVFGTEPKTAVPLDVDGARLAMVRPAALDAVRAALARERGGAK